MSAPGTPRTGRARGLARLLVAGLALAACGADETESNPEATPPAASADTATTGADATAEVDTDAAVAAAVDVRADGCGPRVGFGTGSVVDGGVIVTAAHVVAGADQVEVIATDGERTAARVVLFDPDLDLAVVRPDADVGSPIPVRPDDAMAGERGVVVLARRSDGAGGGEMLVDVVDVAVVRTANITTTDIYLDDEVRRAGFEIEGSIDPGDSGAMVVLPGGGVGLVWARSNRDELRAWGIDLPPEVVDGSVAELDDPVDTGPCIR